MELLLRSNLTKWFICGRESRAASGPIFGTRLRVMVQVEATSKDHAIERLKGEYPFVDSSDWQIMDEFDLRDENGKEYNIGFFGTKLPLKIQ